MVGLLVFFCLYSAKNGGTALMQTVESIQPGWDMTISYLLSSFKIVFVVAVVVALLKFASFCAWGLQIIGKILLCIIFRIWPSSFLKNSLSTGLVFY